MTATLIGKSIAMLALTLATFGAPSDGDVPRGSAPVTAEAQAPSKPAETPEGVNGAEVPKKEANASKASQKAVGKASKGKAQTLSIESIELDVNGRAAVVHASDIDYDDTTVLVDEYGKPGKQLTAREVALTMDVETSDVTSGAVYVVTRDGVPTDVWFYKGDTVTHIEKVELIESEPEFVDDANDGEGYAVTVHKAEGYAEVVSPSGEVTEVQAVTIETGEVARVFGKTGHEVLEANFPGQDGVAYVKCHDKVLTVARIDGKLVDIDAVAAE